MTKHLKHLIIVLKMMHNAFAYLQKEPRMRKIITSPFLIGVVEFVIHNQSKVC